MEEFKRMILKVSDVEGAVATIPSTSDHTDGSWLVTDIYKGELFLNITDNILQTRTDSGIVSLGGSGVTAFLGLSDVPNSYIGYSQGYVKVKSDLSGLEFVLEEDSTLIPTITVGTRALLLTDRNKNLENDGDCTITVPTNASVAFPIGTQIFFTKKAESLDFVASAGVTINSVDSLLEMGRINCGASLLKIGTDEWNLIGELV